MKFPSFKITILNLVSLGLIIWMAYVIMTNPKNQGGDGLSNFFPMVGIISGFIGLIIDQILQATITHRVKVNVIGLVIVLVASGSLAYVLNN